MIKLKDLTTGYSRDKPLLKNYSMKFDKKIYGILGESGCGKTTLLRTIAGLMKPLNGEIIVDGEKITKASKNNIFMMHQNYTSFDWMNCLENILLPVKIKRSVTKEDVKLAKDFLKQVGLENYEKKVSETIIWRAATTISFSQNIIYKTGNYING